MEIQLPRVNFVYISYLLIKYLLFTLPRNSILFHYNLNLHRLNSHLTPSVLQAGPPKIHDKSISCLDLDTNSSSLRSFGPLPTGLQQFTSVAKGFIETRLHSCSLAQNHCVSHPYYLSLLKTYLFEINY